MVVASVCQDMSFVSGFLPLLHSNLSVVGVDWTVKTPQLQRIPDTVTFLKSKGSIP